MKLTWDWSAKNMLDDLKTLRKKCLYLEFFWSAFSRILTKYGNLFSPNVGKCGPDTPSPPQKKKNPPLQVVSQATRWKGSLLENIFFVILNRKLNSSIGVSKNYFHDFTATFAESCCKTSKVSASVFIRIHLVLISNLFTINFGPTMKKQWNRQIKISGI